MPMKKAKDPLRSAALVKLSFELAGNAEHPQFRAIYEGVLRDLKLTEDQVDAYLTAHRTELEPLARGKRGTDEE
jgi:hypothetical protein